MTILVSQSVKRIPRILSTVVPALLIVAVTVYVLYSKPDATTPIGHLAGKPLAAYSDLYPIQNDASGLLHLDVSRFMKAVEYFLNNPSPKATSDLIYMGQANNVVNLLNDEEKELYSRLIKKPEYANFPEIEKQKDKIFQVYKDITNGVGQTLQGTGFEIVLHDTRNPLQSVVAIQNPISGRRIGDSTTNFGIALIKDYSIVDAKGSNFVSYGLTLKDGRNIKSSTIPLFDDTFGLVGFICINIDISKLDKNNPEAIATFIDNFKLVNANSKINELIENSKRKNP